ncbi:DUF742 domain-containing protein [Streptomyces mauvecolor]|uniref:DUF742 domain-containing protein n=1 Tax=Streptomyces sp. HUAS TT7 TaxID=3447507 RepID=UPI003F65DA0B
MNTGRPARHWAGGGPEDPEPEASPAVRPYALTQGRTHTPGAPHLDLMATVVLADPPHSTLLLDPPSGPEYDLILAYCAHGAVTVAELASRAGLLLGVLRVLLGDLHTAGLIHVAHPAAPAQLSGDETLKEVIDALGPP